MKFRFLPIVGIFDLKRLAGLAARLSIVVHLVELTRMTPGFQLPCKLRPGSSQNERAEQAKDHVAPNFGFAFRGLLVILLGKEVDGFHTINSSRFSPGRAEQAPTQRPTGLCNRPAAPWRSFLTDRSVRISVPTACAEPLAVVA